MQLVHTVDQYRLARQGLGECCIGFVPTMGALHAGHASLIERSKSECDFTVVSVFVNPTQFNNPDDLDNYPTTLEQDVIMAESLGAELVFAPSYNDLYPDSFRYRIEETEFSRELCGASRPGHFTGVLTVVMKLLNIVRPQRAYFGEKDYQQFCLVRDMVQAFFLEVEIVPCPIVREEDGLALSSRNVSLDCEGRCRAPMIHQLIDSEASDEAVAQALGEAGFKVDYVVSTGKRRYAAARIGNGPREVRLIDNVTLMRAPR